MRQNEPVQTEGSIIHHARRYDALVTVMSFGRERSIRERIVRSAALTAGERVLDIGCGTGSLALSAKDAVGSTGRVIGIDPSPAMIAHARNKARRSNSDVNFEICAAEALPFDNASFDVVLSTLVFHHLPTDDLRSAVLAEIRRVLVPTGRLLIGDFGGAKTSERIAAEVQAAGFSCFTLERPFPWIWFVLVAGGKPQD